MATTTNYGWVTPDDTALVKDGAAAIRTLGTSADTTVYNNSLATINKTIVDAKGDIIAATAADTVARLAVGTNGQVLTADSTAATGLAYTTISGGAFTSLATGSLSSTTTTISSIPSTYIQLYLVIEGAYVNTATPLKIIYNGSTVDYYQSTIALSGGTVTGATGSGYSISGTNLEIVANSRIYNMTFLDYFKVGYKNVMGSMARNGTGNVLWGNHISNTAAVSSIGITTNNGTSTFSGGTYTLYGVK